MLRRIVVTVAVTLSVVLLGNANSAVPANAETGWGMSAAHVVTSAP
jgi:hypothetical protein